MHTTAFLTTLLSLAALVAVSTASSPDALLEARKATPKYVQYCKKVGGPCGRVEANGGCQSSTSGSPLLFFDKGLKCDVWQQQGCPKKSKNVVKGVQVAFNTNTNLAAKTKGIHVVGSFKC